MQALTRFLALISTRYKTLTITLFAVLATLSAGHAVLYLKFDTNQDNLISEDQTYLKQYTEFLKQFGDWEYIYAVIKLPDNTTLHQKAAQDFAAELEQKLKERTDLFREVVSKIDSSGLKKKFLLFMPENDFEDFFKQLHLYPKDISRFLSISSSAQWYEFAADLIKNRAHVLENSQMATQNDQHLENLLLAPFDAPALNRLRLENPGELPFKNNLPPDYLTSQNKLLYFVRVLPHKDYSRMEIIAEPLQFMREQITALKPHYPSLNVGVTGRPVLQNDEAATTQQDSRIAGLAAFLCVAAVFFVFFRNFPLPFFSLVSLATAICLTAGFVSVVFEQINLITTAFAIILVGLGVDYGIHFLMRYLNEQMLSADKHTAITRTILNTGEAILIGAATSAAAFATAWFTDFLGLKQLGVIAAVGLLLCCLAQLTLYPALISAFKKNYKPPPPPSFHFLKPLLKHPRLVVTVTVLATLAALPAALGTNFNSNLLKLHDQTLESVRFEKIIQEQTDWSTWFLAHKTHDKNKLKALSEKIEKLPLIKKVESLFDFMPTEQEARRQKLMSFMDQLPAADLKNTTLQSALQNLKNALHTRADQAFQAGQVEAFEELDKLEALIPTLHGQAEKHSLSAAPLEKEFLQFLNAEKKRLQEFLMPQPFEENDIPPELLNQYKSPTGEYSLAIYPAKDIWKPENMEAFIKQVRVLIPDVTGAPVTTYESSKHMVAGFVLMSALTSLIILLVIYRSFRNAKITLTVYASLMVTLVWLFALMRLFDIDINLANFFALPILIGSGIDHGVHIFHRFREKHSLDDVYKNTVPAVTLSCLTTIIGFGSLAFVRHAGLASFGLVMTAGTTLILLSSTIVLPNIIKLMYHHSEIQKTC